MENSVTHIDKEIALAAIVALSVVLICSLAAFTIVGRTAFSKTTQGGAKSFGLLFERGNFLRIATVVFVILAVVLLCAMSALNEGAVAILSGVAGYVLGGLEKDKKQDGTDEEEPKQDEAKKKKKESGNASDGQGGADQSTGAG